MKSKFKKAILLVLGTIAYGQLFAEAADTNKFRIDLNKYKTWSVGVSGGISTPYTLIGYNSRQDFTSPDIQWGYGIYIKKQLSYSFGLQVDLMAGKLKADHAWELNPNRVPIYSTVNTKLNWSASLSGNFIIAHINGKGHKGFMQPYLSLGGGVVSYTPDLRSYYTNEVTTLANAGQFFIPVGTGLKINITQSLNFDLGYQVNYIFSDDLDGYKFGPSNDRFSYTHIGLEFALGKRSKQQLATQSRADAIYTEHKAQVKALTKSMEILHADLDAANAKNIKLQNDLDAATANVTRYTTDSDGDGVPDANDKCPNTPAGTQVDGTGCPLPAAKSEVKVHITEQDKKIVNTAGLSLEFYIDQAKIREYSFFNLDRLAQLLTDKNLSLKIEAYTDNSGDADKNLKLSVARAEAVKNYLVGRGVDAAQVQAFGYGSDRPIASNKTASGRRLNRRVELTLF